MEAFKKLRLSILLEDEADPNTTLFWDEREVDSSGDEKVESSDEVTESSPLEEEWHHNTILDTTKRKICWPIAKGILKKRRLEEEHKKKTPTPVH